MMWDETTHNGRVSFPEQRQDADPGRGPSRQFHSAQRKPWHVLYANGDVGSTPTVEATLRQAGASVVHPENVADSLACVDGGSCHLVVINVPRPDVEGMDLLTEVRRRAPWIPVIILVDRGRIDVAVRAIKTGAVDCIERPAEPDCLRLAIDKALGRSRRGPEPSPLTPVERAVLEQFLKGCSNREIAKTLKRSQRTIEVHRSNIMRKLRADGPVQLVRRAIAAGLADAFFDAGRPEPAAPGDQEGPPVSDRCRDDGHAAGWQRAQCQWDAVGAHETVEATAY